MNPTDADLTPSQSDARSGGVGCGLNDIVTSEKLANRPSRLPDYAAENAALVALARELADSPQTILQKLVDTALLFCNAGSAGISVLEHSNGEDVFRWQATSGAFAPYCGGTLPRNFSPCGIVLDRNAIQLMHNPARFYPYITQIAPAVVELLLIPFYRDTVPIGTVWVVSHSEEKQFESEDARLVTSLAKFASAAVQVLSNLTALEAANNALRTEATERARAEASRHETEEFHRFAAEAGRTGSWYVRLDTMECVLSPMMAELMDFPFGQTNASAEQWRNCVVPEDRDGMEAAIGASIQSGVPFDFEFRIGLKDGGQRWLYSRGGVVRDASGKPLRLHGASVDLTHRKRAEAELREARDTAETANRAKDKFLAVLSHELRTPLSPVVMTIPAMEMDPELPFKFREDLAMVRRNIDLELKLIDDLLDLSRVTSGKLRLEMQHIRIHELLRHTVQNSLSDTSGKRLRVGQEFNAINDETSADPARLQQVFWNLLKNAVKFTPQGGDITISTWNDKADGRLHIQVCDSGVGIEPDMVNRIFDAFEQGDARITRQFGGLGLGLAIAKAVVQMHGGSITASSDGKDQGSAFTVVLDTLAVNMTDSPHENLPDAAQKQPQSRTRILLVEDHPDTARTMARLLKHQGYEVKTADSVTTALQLAATQTFDVIVSDIGLPDATGYQLMEQIRDRFGIKGIALSGYGMEEDMRRSRDAGFVDHVVKPINIAQLHAVIQRVTSKIVDAPMLEKTSIA